MRVVWRLHNLAADDRRIDEPIDALLFFIASVRSKRRTVYYTSQSFLVNSIKE
jgi:hypothetical protein